MKTKQFVLFQLRSWLPMIIALGALVLASTLVVGLNAQPYISFQLDDSQLTLVEYYSLYSLKRNPSSCLVPMMIPSLIASFVVPFFAYSHRYGKVRADCFLSLPVKNGRITQVRMLLAGAILLAIYLVSYLLGIAVAIVKQSATAAAAVSTLSSYSCVTSYEVATGLYGWYFLAWPLGALVVASLFLINSFLVGQGSNVLQGVIALILGHLAIALLFPMIVLTPSSTTGNYDSLADVFGMGWSFFQMPSFYVPLVLIGGTLGVLEENVVSAAAWTSFLTDWGLWFGSSFFLLLGGGALASLLLGKEPGGEFAGENKPRSFFATLIPHLGFLALLLGSNVLSVNMFGARSSYLLFFVLAEFVWVGGLYYVAISLYNHNFKLNRTNWILFASMNGASLLAFMFCLLYRLTSGY